MAQRDVATQEITLHVFPSLQGGRTQGSRRRETSNDGKGPTTTKCSTHAVRVLEGHPNASISVKSLIPNQRRRWKPRYPAS